MTELEQQMINVLKNIQMGELMTYKEVAVFAGYPTCARQVSRVLKKYSSEYNLPWQRVVGSGYKISLKNFEGFEIQRKMLEEEGFFVSDKGKIKKQDKLKN